MKNLEKNLEIKNIDQFLILEKIAKIAHISQCPTNHPRNFFGYFNYIFLYIESQKVVFYQVFNRRFVPTISLKMIIYITTIIMAVVRNQNLILITSTLISLLSKKSDSRFKKQLNILKYNVNNKKLNI